MPSIAAALKEEIARVARKELRDEMTALRKTSLVCRAEIAALKRRAHALEQEVRAVRRTQSDAAPGAAPRPSVPRVARFSARGLAAQRRRLGLSAEDCGLLVGASGQSIYNWEAAKSRPRARHAAAIAALRAVSRKEAAARLEQLRQAA